MRRIGQGNNMLEGRRCDQEGGGLWSQFLDKDKLWRKGVIYALWAQYLYAKREGISRDKIFSNLPT